MEDKEAASELADVVATVEKGTVDIIGSLARIYDCPRSELSKKIKTDNLLYYWDQRLGKNPSGMADFIRSHPSMFV